MRGAPQLSIHDGFAFALAETYTGCVLLTGDGSLRALAAAHRMEVHGVLWVVDKIHGNKVGTAAWLHAALLVLADDPSARLPPRRELAAAIKWYDRLLVTR